MNIQLENVSLLMLDKNMYSLDFLHNISEYRVGVGSKDRTNLAATMIIMHTDLASISDQIFASS